MLNNFDLKGYLLNWLSKAYLNSDTMVDSVHLLAAIDIDDTKKKIFVYVNEDFKNRFDSVEIRSNKEFNIWQCLSGIQDLNDQTNTTGFIGMFFDDQLPVLGVYKLDENSNYKEVNSIIFDDSPND